MTTTEFAPPQHTGKLPGMSGMQKLVLAGSWGILCFGLFGRRWGSFIFAMGLFLVGTIVPVAMGSEYDYETAQNTYHMTPFLAGWLIFIGLYVLNFIVQGVQINKAKAAAVQAAPAPLTADELRIKYNLPLRTTATYKRP